MDLDISSMLEKLKEIEGFASKVDETKKLADDLAMNFAKMKEQLNKTINDSMNEIADQIELLRKNMEAMAKVKPETKGAETKPVEKPPAEPEPAKPEPKPEVAEEPMVEQPEQAPKTPEPAPVDTPPTTAEKPAEVESTEEAIAAQTEAVTEEVSDEREVLLQKKDRLKAELTDLRFDYMRGYIPEEEYKSKEAELDSKLENIDKQLAEIG
jgi:outer membrane biosynthesis protein TonB